MFYCHCLKPQDSFGTFVKIFVDLQKVDHGHQKAPLGIKPTDNCFEWHVVMH